MIYISRWVWKDCLIQNNPIPHILLICCRVSCKGKTGESRLGPQQAWQRLMTIFKKKSCPAAQEGMKAFGLNHPGVFQHIVKLTNANRCENFCAWPEGKVPDHPKLVRLFLVQYRLHDLTFTEPENLQQLMGTIYIALKEILCSNQPCKGICHAKWREYQTTFDRE